MRPQFAGFRFVRRSHALRTSSFFIAIFRPEGMAGYEFRPLKDQDIAVHILDVRKGHDTFHISNALTRIYYIIEGKGVFPIDNQKYDVVPSLHCNVNFKAAREVEELKSSFMPSQILLTTTNRHQHHRLISQLIWNTRRDHMIVEYGNEGFPTSSFPFQWTFAGQNYATNGRIALI